MNLYERANTQVRAKHSKVENSYVLHFHWPDQVDDLACLVPAYRKPEYVI